MTICLAIECPHCHSTKVVKHGKLPVGKQRYRCQNCECPCRSFILSQTYSGQTQQVKQQIMEMTLKLELMHDLVIGLFINRYKFGLSI